MLQGKKILLGVTGSIAAYKSAQIIRLLVREGAEVKVIMTPLAKEFITPLTLATLARNPILVDFFDPTNGNWNSHVDLGLWADLFIIAPATANTNRTTSAACASSAAPRISASRSPRFANCSHYQATESAACVA